MASATATGKGAGRRSLNMVLFYVFLVLFVFVSIFPLLWVFKMSIVTKAELYATPPTLLPQNLSGAEWAQVLGDSTFQQALINSMIIATVTTVICLFFGSICGLRDRQVEVPVQERRDDPDTRDQLLPSCGDHRPALHPVHRRGPHKHLLRR